jgi:hypothetical protein
MTKCEHQWYKAVNILTDLGLVQYGKYCILCNKLIVQKLEYLEEDKNDKRFL